MKALRLIPNHRETAQIISEFLLNEDVFDYIDNRLRSFMGIYDLITRINNQEYFSFATIDEDKNVIGISWGTMYNGDFYSHIACKRHSKARLACNLMEDVMIANLEPKRMVGWIPVTYRHANINALRQGMKTGGIVPNVFFIDKDGNEIECREYIKVYDYGR
jgi:hypothetical protein